MEIIFLALMLSAAVHSSPPRIGRIYGGTPANPGEFPYQVSIQAYDRASRDYIPICGGVILNPTTILSAAHCILLDPDGLYRVVAGEYDLSRTEGPEQFRFVERVVAHEDFDDFSKLNDIALYFLPEETPLVFNQIVGSLSLPPPNYVAAGTALMAGWGLTSNSVMLQPDSEPGVLNKLTIPFYPDETCEGIYGQDFDKDMMICAGSLDGGRDACAGDSGGPLVSYYSGERIIAGLVSWGPGSGGCGQQGYLGVYTKVANYVEWISYVMNVLGRDN